MNHSEDIRLYSVVPQPFAEVRSTVQHRTAATTDHPERFSLEWLREDAARLGIHMAGVDLTAPVSLTTSSYTDVPGVIPAGIVHLRFRPTGYGKLAPQLDADLEIQAIDDHATLVSLLGQYRPPFGAAGIIADRALMHRLATAGLQRFFSAVVRELRRVRVAG